MVDEVKLEDTLNKRWKDDKTGFGFKMLQKMGWKEEKGLGKNEDGMASSIKIKKRDTALGLGVQSDTAGNHGWGSTVHSFNQVLNILNETYGESVPKKKKKSKNIEVRIKYKKHSAAKDLSSKTPQELAAILGHGGVSKTQSLVNESDEDEKASKKKRKDKKKESKKTPKRKRLRSNSTTSVTSITSS